MKEMRLGIYISFVILSFIVICSSCGGDDDSISTLEEYLEVNNITAQQTSSGLFYSIEVAGNGPSIEDGSFIVFNITQFNFQNTPVGGNSDARFPVALEVSGLLTGLREGMQLLKKGGRADFFIPPSLSGGRIQTGALIFTVEVLEVYDSLTDYNEGEIEKYLSEEGLVAMKTAEGLYVIIEEPGEDPRPESGSMVTVDYHGYFLNGDVFDSSLERGVPATFSLDGVIEGWTLGIPLFGIGGKGKLFIPSNLAYGAGGNPNIPGNYPLAFDIELISVQ